MCATIYQDLHSISPLCVEATGQLYLSRGLLSEGPEYDVMISVMDKSLRLRPEVGIFVV